MFVNMHNVVFSSVLAALLALATAADTVSNHLRSATVVGDQGTSGCTPGDTSFEILLLVEQWPGTLEINAPGFTMHGLWPSRTGANVANYPCQCTNETFDLSLVQPIITELNTYWMSDKGDNPTFWTHEYEKHGTCAEQLTELGDELKFFKGTLGLRQSIDTQGALSKAKITPSFTSTYSASDMNAAFSKASILKCNSSGYLTEVGSCFDKTLTQIDCEADTYGGANCPSTGIHYVPASGWNPKPSPSPSPHHPSPQAKNQCVKDEHGPKCTTDAECQQYPHCIRCASSGYCTLVPKDDESL